MINNYDHTVCEKCSRREENKPSCPYRDISLTRYCDYKNIPYYHIDNKIKIDTSNLMNSSAMIELKNEILRTGYVLKESGWDYMIIKEV